MVNPPALSRRLRRFSPPPNARPIHGKTLPAAMYCARNSSQASIPELQPCKGCNLQKGCSAESGEKITKPKQELLESSRRFGTVPEFVKKVAGLRSVTLSTGTNRIPGTGRIRKSNPEWQNALNNPSPEGRQGAMACAGQACLFLPEEFRTVWRRQTLQKRSSSVPRSFLQRISYRRTFGLPRYGWICFRHAEYPVQ